MVMIPTTMLSTMIKEIRVPSARGIFVFRSKKLTSGTVIKDKSRANTNGYVYSKSMFNSHVIKKIPITTRMNRSNCQSLADDMWNSPFPDN